jgi:FAD/FMN-containing dehydrogenase
VDPITRRELAWRAAVGGAALVVPGCSGGGKTAATRGTSGRTAPAVAAGDPLRSLRRDFRGPLLRRGTAGYEPARLCFNVRYDGIRPRAVAQPLDTRDVQTLVRWSASSGVRLAARSGGHSYAGYSTVHDGVLVDLSRLRGVGIHPSAGTVTIGAGSQLLDVYNELAGHGLTIPAGTCPSVGIGGHLLGGGMGLAGRKLGLACDRLRSARIVTADGRALHCTSRTHPDLFWALRGGGGGNFGIVTQLELAPHAVSQASWFFCSWPWSMASEALDAWQRFAPHAPAALTSILTLGTGSATPTVSALGQHFGSEAELRGLVAPLTRVAGASLSTGTSGYLDLMLRWAGCLDRGLVACHTEGTRPGGVLPRDRFAAKSDYIDRYLNAAGRQALVSAVERRQATPAEGSGALVIDAYGGAINALAPDHTAFVHRNQLYSVQQIAYFGPAGERGSLAWLRSVHDALRPHASGMAYQNYIDPDLAGWRRAYYGANYRRLTEVKRRYDPDNLFRFAQSIHPV